MLERNSELGQYRITEKLGEGGMGEVWLAEDTRLKRKVAIKILPEVIAHDQLRLQRFEQEAFSASGLNHPNILTIYEFGKGGSSHYLVSELVDGETLRAKLRSGRLSITESVDVALQTAAALAAAHAARIIHRDIKPENLMIRKDEFVKVLDFGLAKLIDEPQGNEEDKTKKLELTEAGTVMGTVAYMSPEQARGLKVDGRTDLFSLGVVLYEMLSGEQPFKGETVNHTIVAILEKEPPVLPPSIPESLQRVVQRLLRKAPEERYSSAQELVSALKELQLRLLVNSGDTVTSIGEPAATTFSRPETADSSNKATVAATTLPRLRKTRLWVLAGVIVLASLVALGYYAVSRTRLSTSQISSLAVLPFVNDSKEADVEYLSDGMTETLISSLSQLPGLNVKPRSSVFRYKGKDATPQAVAKDLNVQAIINGRVVQRGQDLTLYVELINTAQDKVVWSDTYNRRQADLVSLQADLARDVVGKIKSRLSGTDEARVTRTYTTDPEAYQLYLKGNFYRTKYTEQGYLKALDYYRQAIAKDPNYALAYHGIAAAYEFANGFYLPAKDAMPKAKDAAMKALELDDKLAETHFLLGKILFWYEWDWAASEREWKRAHELDPTLPEIYPVYLSAMGRHDEAMRLQAKVLERLPLDLNVNLDSAGTFLWAGRPDDTIRQLNKALELDPGFWWSNEMLGLAYERKKQYQEAIAAMEKALQSEVNPSSLGYLGYLYGVVGRKDDARKTIERLKGLAKTRYVSPYALACIHAGLNDREETFRLLDQSLQERSFYAVLLKIETIFSAYWSDPRYGRLLHQAKLQE